MSAPSRPNRQSPLPLWVAREIAATLGCCERSVQKRAKGQPVRGAVADRIDAALQKYTKNRGAK